GRSHRRDGARHGERDPGRRLHARLRALLHDEGSRERHGTRAGDCLRHRPGARWPHLGGQPSGRRRHLHRRAAGSGGAGTDADDDMIDETFLTTEEVLEYLQVNLRTVYRLIKAGKIPAVRVGRQWRFRKRDIDAWLDSQRPRGSSARVAGAPAPAPRPGPSAARPRGLVVDDEASIRDLLAKTLALAEYDVDVAPDGRSALERMRLYPYDLLIADLKMPGMDGLT